MKLKTVPLELKQANEFVDKLHRHHDSVHRDKFRIGCEVNGKLVGVVQLARPVSRVLDDGKTIEVVRLCTDGTPNVCSFLYSRAARIATEIGYSKIITYILESESGTSLKACGWHKEADTKGHNWSCASRPRSTTAPTCNKQRWAKNLDAGRKVQMIKDKIDKVVESYYNETDECYNSLRYDNNENDFYMKDEIENLLKEAEADFKIEIKSGFSNCAYDSEFIAVAWIEEGKLNMRTILTEDY